MRPSAARGRGLRRWAATAAGLALVGSVAVLAGGPGATASPGTAAATPAAAAPQAAAPQAAARAAAAPALPAATSLPGVTVAVADIAPAELTPGGAITLQVTVEGELPAGGAELVVSRTASRTATVSALADWQAGSSLPAAAAGAAAGAAAPLRELVRVSVPGPAAAPGASRGPVPLEVTLGSAAVDLPTTLAAAGPYGLRLDAVLPGEALDASLAGDARGFLVWSPTTVALPTELVTLATIAGPAPDPETGLVPEDLLEADMSSAGRLRRVLDLAAGLEATWAVDPMLVASAAAATSQLTPDPGGPSSLVRPVVATSGGEPLRGPGAAPTQTPGPDDPGDDPPDDPGDDSAPPTAVERWLDDLGRLRGDREVVSTGWAWPDYSRLAATSDPAAARTVIDRVVDSTVSSIRLEDLLAGPIRDDVAILPEGTGSVPALAAVDPEVTGVVLAEGDFPLSDPLALTFTPDEVAVVPGPRGDLDAVLLDGALSTALTRAAEGDALARTEVLAILAATTVQRPSDARLLAAALPPTVSPDPEASALLAQDLRTTTWAQPVDLATALGTAVPAVEREWPADPAAGASVPSQAAPSAVESLLGELTRAHEIAGAFGDTQDRRRAGDRRVAGALSSLAPRAAVEEQADELAQQAAATIEDVQLVPGSRVTLATREAPLRFTVVNDLASPVELVLHVAAANPRVQVRQPETVVELSPGVRTTVDVPVTAVGSGRADVTASLRTRAGAAWGSPVDLEVNVATLVESRALIAAAVVVGAVFVVGAVRSVRRNRRRAELEEQA